MPSLQTYLLSEGSTTGFPRGAKRHGRVVIVGVGFFILALLAVRVVSGGMLPTVGQLATAKWRTEHDSAKRAFGAKIRSTWSRKSPWQR